MFSQSDTILERIQKEKNDTVRLKHLNDRVWDLMFSDKKNCELYIEKIIEESKEIGNPRSLSDSYNTLGCFYMITSDFNKSVEWHQKALDIRTKINDKKGLMKTYNNLGGAYKYLGAHKKEIDYYFLALKMAEEFKDTLVITSVMNNIADAFERQNDFDKCLEYNNKVLSIREKQNTDKKGIASTLINLGTAYYKKKDFASSETYFKRAEKAIEEIEDNYIKALFHANYSALLKDDGRFDEAILHINTSISLHESIGNTNGNLVNYINIASILEEKTEYRKANEAYQKSLKLSLAVGNLIWQRQSYLGLSTTYFQLGNYKEAYDNQIRYEKLKDSLTNSDLRTKIEEIEEKYGNQKLAQENELLLRQNTIQQLESKQKGYVIASLITLILVALLILYLFTRNYKFKQELKLREITVAAEENERQRIAKDIHDELGSGLTKIRFMSEKIKNETQGSLHSVNTISETANSLVENMRDLIWVMNPENSTLENLIVRIREYSGQYVEEFTINLSFLAPESIPSLKINMEVGRNVFMIVKEALQNIIKHSEAEKASIKIIIGHRLIIEVSDNGKGGANERRDGNGLLNMKHRANQLNGTLDIVSEVGNGTIVRLTVPLT
jgi:signal transduction histidine kinase